MQIKEKSDDARLAALNRPIDLTSETKKPEQLNPIARSKPVEERRAEQYQPRKKGDRRKGDRRKEDRSVLLDTRSKRERRKGPRRSEERETAKPTTEEKLPSGIDVKC